MDKTKFIFKFPKQSESYKCTSRVLENKELHFPMRAFSGTHVYFQTIVPRRAVFWLGQGLHLSRINRLGESSWNHALVSRSASSGVFDEYGNPNMKLVLVWTCIIIAFRNWNSRVLLRPVPWPTPGMECRFDSFAEFGPSSSKLEV